MGAVNYGFFFFLLSKILSVNCLPNNPSNSIPFQGQNAPVAPNSWTGQPVQSVLQGMTNIFDAMNPNPSQNTYVNNNDNQQNIKYGQQHSTPQPYNSPHYNNYNQQYSMSQPYNVQLYNYEQQSIIPQPYNKQPNNYKQQSTVPQTYNEQPHNYKQQSSVPQPYNAPHYNYGQQSSMFQPSNAPQVIQKNQNQHSKEPQLYNLHPPSQSSGQKNSQSFGTIVPSLKQYQKQLPSSINQPIEILPAIDQPNNNAKNQNIQQSSSPNPPNPNQSQLSQLPSNLSKPIVKGPSTSNGYNVDNKEAEVSDFVHPNNNVKNQENIQQSYPPNEYDTEIKGEVPDFDQVMYIAENQENKPSSAPSFPSIPNQLQLSKPIVKGPSTSNGYNVDNKEAEVSDFVHPNNNVKNQENIQQSSPPNEYDTEIKGEVPDFDQVMYIAENQENKPSSAPSFPSIPNQLQLSKPIVKGPSTSNGYNVDNKEAEVSDFVHPNNNVKNQENIQQSYPPNEYDTEIKGEVPDFDQVMYIAENQENKPSSAPSFPSIPNQLQLSKPIVKGPSTSNGYNVDNKEAEVSDFVQPINNYKNQENIQQSFPPNEYDTEIKGEVPDFDQVMYIAENQENKPSSAPSFPSIPNQLQLSKPIVKGPSTSNGYNVDNKVAEVSDFVQPINNYKYQENIQQSSPPNEYDTEIKGEVPDFDQVMYIAENQENKPSSAPSFPSIPNQLQLSKPIVKGPSTSNGYNVDNKEAEVSDFVQPINNYKNQENIQQSSPPNEYDTEIKGEVPDFDQVMYIAENQENKPSSAPSFPSIPNQLQLSKPIVKGPSTSNGYNVDNKEAEVSDFVHPNNNVKNQENIQQSSPPNEYDTEIKGEVPDFDQVMYIAENQENKPSSAPSFPSIPNQLQLSKPIVKGPSTSNGYNVDNKEAEVSDFVQPINNYKNQENIKQSSPPNEYDTEIKGEVPDFDQVMYIAENQENKPSSAPSFPSIPNQLQLSKPIVKGPSTSNGYNVDNKEAEVSDFVQPINNYKNQENIQQSFPPNEYDTEIKGEVPDFDQVMYIAENQENKPSSAPSFPSIPNQLQLSKPIVKGPSTSNGYNVDNKVAEVSDFVQPINNYKYQENIQQSSPPNEYDTEIKGEVPDFDQVMYIAENQENKPSSAPSFPSIPNQLQLSKPIVKGPSTSNGYNVDNKEAEVSDFVHPNNNVKNQENIQQSSPPNEYDTEIKGEVPDFDQVMYIAENQENKPSSATSFPSIPNQLQLSKPIVKGPSTSNGYNVDNKEAEVSDFVHPNNNVKNQENIQQSSPPNEYDTEIKGEVPDFDQVMYIAENQENKPSSATSFPSIPNQLQLSKPLVKGPSTSNGFNVDNKEAEVSDFVHPNNNVKNQKNVQQSSPLNEYDTEIKGEVPDVDQVMYIAENQENKPSSAPYFPLYQSKVSQIPSQSSSKLMPIENTMQITNDNMSLNSFLALPDGQSEPITNDFAQNEDVLIENSQADIQSFLNLENNNILNPSNNVLESQDDSQLVFNDLPPQFPMNVQAANMIIDSQSNDLISNMDLNDDTENLQNTLNEDSLPANIEDTEFNEESKLENTMSESPVVALDDTDTENDKLYSLENLTFDAPPPELDGLSNYDSSFIVDTENPKNAKEDNAKITVYANPNDVHILQLSSKQSSTNDNSYLINNKLLNTPSTGIPLWYSSFPNGADYVQNFNSNTNKQQSDSLFNFNQNPAYYQIPMYLENSNNLNQQAAVDQNQMTSKIQSHDLSLDDNQPSSVDNSGSIYKKVDLKNPPPNSSNSWSLLKKDYTKNLRPNQNDRYTSDDGTTRTSFFGTPLSSYQNSNQEILNLPSNDMFVQNMISVISNSVQAPLDGTKAIFDVTSANFPRSSVSHIIRLTHAIVRSVMLNLRQTLNTFMKTLYGLRVKRDFNPFEVLHNLPGALVNKYSLQSTAAPTTKNINSPYYNQPTTAADYSVSQSATENMFGRQQTYGNAIDKNYYGSQDNNIGVVPQPASTQNYVLNSLIDAIISAVRSNIPVPYSIDSPEVKQYTQQVIVTAEIVFKNQIDNILHGQSPMLNMY